MKYLHAFIGGFERYHYFVGAALLFLTTILFMGWAVQVSATDGYSAESTESTITGTTATITWTAPSDRVTRIGWVGIYDRNASDSQFTRWTYINSAANSGTVTFTNLPPGTYEARFYSGSGYDRQTTSPTFTIAGDDDTPDPDPNPNPDSGGTDDYALTLSASSISVGGNITVTFEAPTNSNRSADWIGLYKVGATNQQYEAWRYTGASASGALSFAVTTTGQYEFRYLKNNGYIVVAVSSPITVSGAVAQCAITNLDAITNYPPSNGPIVAFGDSLTAGVGATPSQDYVSQLSRLAEVPIINTGIPGDTTRTALARLENDVLSRNPSTVIVWLGGNDVLVQYYDRVVRGLESPTLINLINATLNRLGSSVTNSPVIPEDETFENLETIVRTIQADGAVVILVGFSGAPFDSDLESRFAAVASETGAIYVPNALSGVIGRPSLMSDIIHPNDAGYTIVTNRIYQRLLCVQ